MMLLVRHGYCVLSHNLVRADITYLRQDFSVMLDVPSADPWPTTQRFDYLVRTRVLPPHVQSELECVPPTPGESPQRDALLYALRRLTGKDAGDDAQQWRAMFAAQ